MLVLLVAAPMLWAPPAAPTAAPPMPYAQPVPWVPRALPPSHPSLMIPLPDAGKSR